MALLVLRITGGLGLSNLDDPRLVAEVQAHRNDVSIQLVVARAGLKNGQFFCEGLPDWVCHRIRTRIDFDHLALLKQSRVVVDQMAGNWSAAMFLLMPAFALGLRLL